VGVLLGSLSSALLAVALLRVRNRRYRRRCSAEALDDGGVPDRLESDVTDT
jgi:hypothetical protein